MKQITMTDIGAGVCRQFPAEPAAAYQALKNYLELRPPRDLATAFELWSQRQSTADIPAESPPDFLVFMGWAVDWAWAERAATFDRQRARVKPTPQGGGGGK